MRLIDQDDNQIGIVEIDRALGMAREAELDLVEVSPNSAPPVCRIMDYGKWKYQQKKKEQKSRSGSKASEMKEVYLRPNTDVHDLHIKTEKAREFLTEGHKVQFIVEFKGREMAHREIGFGVLKGITEQFAAIAKQETPPRAQGKRMTMILAPGAKAPPVAPPAKAPGTFGTTGIAAGVKPAAPAAPGAARPAGSPAPAAAPRPAAAPAPQRTAPAAAKPEANS